MEKLTRLLPWAMTFDRTFTVRLILMFIFLICFQWACKKEDDPIKPGSNKAPIAKAGRDTTIFIPEIRYTLNGSDSYDPDDQYIRYSWRQIKGPDLYSFHSDGYSAYVIVNREGRYEFELTVKDPGSLLGLDTVVLNVADDFAEGKVPVIKLQCNSIRLPTTAGYIDLIANAYVSNDQGQTYEIKTGFSAKQISGPAAALIGDPYLDYLVTSIPISSLNKGTYQFVVSLTRKGLTGYDTATVEVTDDTVQAKEYIFETKWTSDVYRLVARTPELQHVFYVWPYRKSEVFVLLEGDQNWYPVKAWDWDASMYYTINACNSVFEVLLNEPIPNAEIGRKVTIKVKIS